MKRCKFCNKIIWIWQPVHVGFQDYHSDCYLIGLIRDLDFAVAGGYIDKENKNKQIERAKTYIV